MATIDALLQQFAQSGASDLHLQSGQRPQVRRGAGMADGAGAGSGSNSMEALDAPALLAMTKEIASAPEWAEFERGGACLLVYALDQHRYRISVQLHSSGVAVVCRKIPVLLPAFDALGLSPVLKDMARQRSGLIVIAGAARTGRSTTVAALIQELNQLMPRRVLTLEHPVEFVFPSGVGAGPGAGAGAATIVHREANYHCSTNAHALSAAIHQGFDAVYAGELEGRDMIEAALEAAEAGLLVIATLRATSAMRAVEHIVGALPPVQHAWVRMMLFNTLRCVSAQVLATLVNGTGRCAVQEMLVGTPGICAAIRDGNTSKLGTMIQAGGADGMVTLDDALMRKVQAKAITPAEAQVHASDKQRFAAMIAAEKPAAPEPPAAPAKSPPHAGGGAGTVPPPPGPKKSVFT